MPTATRGWWHERTPCLVIVIAGLMNMFVIADDDVMPLWGSAPRVVGGLGLDTQRIGGMLGGIGVFILLMFLGFGPLNDRLGTLRVFQGSATLLIPALLLTPVATLFSSDTAMWCWLLAFGAAKATAVEYVIISGGMLVNNAVSSQHRGAVNGAAEVAGSLGRLLAPPLSSPLFAWSLQNGRGFPLNHFAVFWVNALLVLATLVLAAGHR